MKLLTIKLDQSCPFSSEIESHIYELGHDVVLDNIAISPTKFDYQFKRYYPKYAGSDAADSIFLSITYSEDEKAYTVSALQFSEKSTVLIASSKIPDHDFLNGADVYQKLLVALEGIVSDTLVHLSNEIIDKPYLSGFELANVDEIDLNALSYWHHSNEKKLDRLYTNNLYKAFEQTVALYPANIAIKYGNQAITYAELQLKVTQYANKIKAQLEATLQQHFSNQSLHLHCQNQLNFILRSLQHSS